MSVRCVVPKRVDRNQKSIVESLRKVGATVWHTHEAGKGAPDIVVGFRGKNYLFEIKDPEQPPNKRKLTGDEELFHSKWEGQVDVIHTSGEALEKMGMELTPVEES